MIMEQSIKITAIEIKAGRYIPGSLDFDGNILIAEDLGEVRFTRLKASGNIFAGGDTSISCDEDIVAGGGIKAGGSIEAGTYIEAGKDIQASKGIQASGRIQAGGRIKAGFDIKAGFGITASGDISVGLSVFAGLVSYRKPSSSEMEIRCRRLTSGEVAYGTLMEEEK